MTPERSCVDDGAVMFLLYSLISFAPRVNVIGTRIVARDGDRAQWRRRRAAASPCWCRPGRPRRHSRFSFTRRPRRCPASPVNTPERMALPAAGAAPLQARWEPRIAGLQGARGPRLTAQLPPLASAGGAGAPPPLPPAARRAWPSWTRAASSTRLDTPWCCTNPTPACSACCRPAQRPAPPPLPPAPPSACWRWRSAGRSAPPSRWWMRRLSRPARSWLRPPTAPRCGGSGGGQAGANGMREWPCA